MGSIRLMIVSPHRLFRESLARSFGGGRSFEVVTRPADPARVLDAVAVWRPAVVLLDLDPPSEAASSRRLVRELIQGWQHLKVLLTGIHDLDPEVLSCIEEGAAGYVDKRSSELVESIVQVTRGQVACPPRLVYSMFSRLGELSREDERSERSEALTLTARELEILQLIAEGFSNKRIADQLCLSIYTVKNHVHHILHKLQVRGRAEAVSHAAERRWFQPRAQPEAPRAAQRER